MTSLQAASIWIALNVLLLVFLSARVGQARMRNKVSLGHGDNDDVLAAIRCQGNYIEYAPAALLGLVVLALIGAGNILIHILGAVFFIGRLAHMAGLGMGIWPKGRMIGTMLTMLTLLVTAACLIFYAFAG